MAEIAVRTAAAAALAIGPINVTDHPAVFYHQRRFVEDRSLLKALFCTRRSAKSFTAGLCLIDQALKNPGMNFLFLGLTRASAKGIIWKDILKSIDRTYQLGIRFNESDLTATLPNGSVIYITGADANESEMLKLLGKKYRFVALDEASMYTIDMRNLVYGVLQPATADPNAFGESGTIAMFGTASDFPQGLFFDVTTGKERGWSLHTWSAYDNPHVAKQWGEAIERIRTDRPDYMETPQFKQWYLNEWVIDQEKLCYKFSVEKNLVKTLPMGLSPDGWYRVLGIDTGWEDDNAFVLNAYHEHNPNMYTLRSWSKPKMTFDEVTLKIREFMDDPHWAPHKIVIDGANKQGVESMRARSQIPFEYADKQDKATFIELANGDLVQSKIKVLENEENTKLYREMMALVWKTDGDKIMLPKKEHPRLPNHRCDAWLYSWRMGYHYHATKPEEQVIKGSRQWYEKQAENIWERERQQLIAAQSQAGDDWLFPNG